MRAKPTPASAGVGCSRRAPRRRGAPAPRGSAAAPIAIVLALALGLRLWGIEQGLPYVYNVDEYGHFVPEAMAMFDRGLDPHYFVNPPALTYLLHVVFAVALHGASATREFTLHPSYFYLLARVTVALLGTACVWLLYMLGVRLFDRAVGLLASSLMAVAFLPVYYGHLALNDAPTMLPLTLSLYGSAGVLRKGRRRDYLLAGTGAGLAAATKYTAAIVLLPLLAATCARYRESARAGASARRAMAVGGVLAGLGAIAAFILANPYAVLDFHLFSKELAHQSTYAQMSRASWVGGPGGSAFVYYLWSFTWGLGWLPALAALGGLASTWRSEKQVGWMLVPAPLLYLAFLSLQGRFFGRWLLPVMPFACLLAAHFALALSGRAAHKVPRLRPTLLAAAALALLAQGLLYSIHSGLVLARSDTRNLARAWMLAHVPAGERVVVEPVVPRIWLADRGRESPTGPAGSRWQAYPTLRLVLDPASARPEPPRRTVLLEDYERTLGPALVDYYERHGYCWVLSATTQSGRASVHPSALPSAIAYYRALQRQGRVVYRVSPYGRGAQPVGFDFDWTFDYYPLAYHRPGPEIAIYRLQNGRCAGPPLAAGRRAYG